MREKDWQQQVLDLARLYRWLSYHTYDSRRSAEGFLDLTLVRDDRLIFAELKAENGRLTPHQLAWIEALKRVRGGVEVYVWRPSDFDEVERVLKSGPRPLRANFGALGG